MGLSLVKGILKNLKHSLEVYGYDAIKEVQDKAINDIENLKPFYDLNKVESEKIDFYCYRNKTNRCRPTMKELR